MNRVDESVQLPFDKCGDSDGIHNRSPLFSGHRQLGDESTSQTLFGQMFYLTSTALPPITNSYQAFSTRRSFIKERAHEL